MVIRKHAELEKVFEATDQTVWEGSTGLEGERFDEEFGPVNLHAPNFMHLC